MMSGQEDKEEIWMRKGRRLTFGREILTIAPSLLLLLLLLLLLYKVIVTNTLLEPSGELKDFQLTNENGGNIERP